MKIQEILTEAGYPNKSDNRNRATRQINEILKLGLVKIQLVKKGYIRETQKGFKWNTKVSGFGKATVFYSNQTFVEPRDVLISIAKHLKRADVTEKVKADITLPCKCGKCSGTGFLAVFAYYAEGVCFDCMGSGYTTHEANIKLNKKRTPGEKIREFNLYWQKRSVGFATLKKIRCFAWEGHKTAQHWILEDAHNMYLGQPDCQNGVDYQVPKEKWEEFKLNYMKVFKHAEL